MFNISWEILPIFCCDIVMVPPTPWSRPSSSCRLPWSRHLKQYIQLSRQLDQINSDQRLRIVNGFVVNLRVSTNFKGTLYPHDLLANGFLVNTPGPFGLDCLSFRNTEPWFLFFFFFIFFWPEFAEEWNAPRLAPRHCFLATSFLLRCNFLGGLRPPRKLHLRKKVLDGRRLGPWGPSGPTVLTLS